MTGDLVVAEYELHGEAWLKSYSRLGGAEFHEGTDRCLPTHRATGLALLIIDHVVVRSGPDAKDLSLYRGSDLLPLRTVAGDDTTAWPIDLPLPEQPLGCKEVSVLVFEKGGVDLVWFEIGKCVKPFLVPGQDVDWLPDQVPEVTLHKPRLAWGHNGPGIVEIAGLNSSLALYWLRLSLGANQNTRLKLLATACKEGFRTASLLGSSRIAAITRENRVLWLRPTGDKLEDGPRPTRLPSLSPAVACFYTRPTEELVVLLANGYLVRLAVPT